MNTRPKAHIPDFCILGAAKCGTTSLHAWLDGHPDILMSSPKEPFFFEAEYERGLDHYWDMCFASRWNGERLVGEARHRNLYFPYVPPRVREANPDARFIVLLREPVMRAYSHWWHWYSRGMESMDFRTACEADLARIARGEGVQTPEEIAAYARVLDAAGKGPYLTYVDTGYYAEQLERWFALFPRERFLVLWFEELTRDPRETVRACFRFLGVDEAIADSLDYPVHNAHGGIDWKVARRNALRLLGASPLRALLPQTWRGEVGRPPVDRGTRQWLAAHFRPHNERLATLLGVDLSQWNDPARKGG